MATNAWGVAPPQAAAWADAVEEEEEKHGAVLAPLAKDDDFPSLAVTKNVKDSKKEKKKKEQKLSLGDFMKSGIGSRQTDDEILMSLPTAPRARAPGEAPPERGLGGGFGRDYGDRRGGGFGRGRDDDDGPPRRMREEDMGPSRAEISDNWGKDRKFEPSAGDRGRGFGGGGFGDRGGGSFRDRDGSRDDHHRSRDRFDDGPSRADTSDNWGANRQFVPSGPRGGGGGFDDRGPRGGFGDRDRERDRGFGGGGFREPSKADLEDRWERKGDFQPTAFEDRPGRGDRFDDRPRGRGFGESWGGAGDGSRDGPRRESFRDRDDGGREASQDRWGRRGDDAAPPAAAANEGPRERPKLNLAPRSASVDKSEAGAAAPAGAKPNPFGAARPREEVLREQGRDYRKEELQLEHKAAEVIREETEEERRLQEQIDELRVKVEAGEADAPLDPSDGAEGKTVGQELEECELRLSKLQLELDDKVRYARRQQGEGRDGPRRDDARGFSQERSDSRRYDRDSRDGRRHEEREERRGFDDRDRRDDRRDFRSYRDPRSAESRDSRDVPARGGRW